MGYLFFLICLSAQTRVNKRPLWRIQKKIFSITDKFKQMSVWKSRTQTQHDTQSFHKKPLHFDLRPSTQTTLISELPPHKWCFPTQVHIKHNHMTQLFPLKSSHINHVLLLQFADKLSNGCRDKCRVVAFPHKNRSYCPVWALFCPWVALKKILSFTVVACQIIHVQLKYLYQSI